MYGGPVGPNKFAEILPKFLRNYLKNILKLFPCKIMTEKTESTILSGCLIVVEWYWALLEYFSDVHFTGHFFQSSFCTKIILKYISNIFQIFLK